MAFNVYHLMQLLLQCLCITVMLDLEYITLYNLSETQKCYFIPGFPHNETRNNCIHMIH